MNKNHAALPILAGITASTIFGFSFMFSSIALKTTDIFTLLSFRFLLAFLVMTALVLLKIIKVDYRNKNLKLLFLLGLMQPIIYFIFETFGIKNASSSIAGMMIALIPISVAVFSAYFLKERPTKLQWVCIVTSVAGVLFLVLMGGSSFGSVNLGGILCLFVAVLSGTFYNLLSRKLSRVFSPIELTYFMMGLGAVTFTTISLMQHIANRNLGDYFAPIKNSSVVLSLLYLGILSSIVAFLCLNFALSRLEASKSAVFANISTIVSIVAGVVFLKEDFRFYHVIGSVLIVAGVWGTNYLGGKQTKANELSKPETPPVAL